ncbi:MinD/ParA family protein [Paenibacillus herberti]|uniref:Cobyrinic acid a,c-diamide synthase n=1 Tax=Paenibacillus herberti TaxID=1619309 RepID=A0A229P1C8_9BACL|nr:MinD/ParA family protein [Paenibacillus herberti]OXM16002.1 cobyrinic acid a,c-diamide synthase [Paenibacillus herberti]
MSDQAQALRNMILQQNKPSSNKGTRILTVASGKGGVGKSNFSLNFALSLQKLGQKVLIFDADIGMANLDVLMGVPAPYSLYHLFQGQRSIHDIIQLGPGGLHFIAGGSGFRELLHLTEEQLQHADREISKVQGEYDLILFDTGAGLSREAERFIRGSHESIIVTTPEPTSITDAYALVKMVSHSHPDAKFKLIVNRVLDQREGRQTAEKMDLAAQRFLNVQLPYAGAIMDDPHVGKAVRRQTPFSLAYPDCQASRDILATARSYLEIPHVGDSTRTVKGFFHQWLNRKRNL